jgi:hypothetical protein
MSNENHALSTWSKNGRCWLKDDLGPDLGIARVFVFEYESNPGGDGNNRLVDEAQNLLIRLEAQDVRQQPLQSPRSREDTDTMGDRVGPGH